MTRIFHWFLCERWIPCQALTSVLCLHYRPKTVHCSTKDVYTSEITFLALHPCKQQTFNKLKQRRKHFKDRKKDGTFEGTKTSMGTVLKNRINWMNELNRKEENKDGNSWIKKNFCWKKMENWEWTETLKKTF